MGNPDYIPDDIISVINSIVESQLRYYKNYTGTVMKITADGTATIDSIEFGTITADPTTWINCQSGNKNQSSIPAKIGQQVEFNFNGDKDNPKWYHLDPALYLSFNEGLNKSVIFEDSVLTKIIFNKTTGILTLQNNTATINIKTTGAIEIQGGVSPLEKTAKGETLQTQLNQLKADYNAHVHATAALGPPSPPTAPTTADFTTILSLQVKNN